MLINAIFLAADGLSLYGMSKNLGIGETRYLTNEFILRGDFGSFTNTRVNMRLNSSLKKRLKE